MNKLSSKKRLLSEIQDISSTIISPKIKRRQDNNQFLESLQEEIKLEHLQQVPSTDNNRLKTLLEWRDYKNEQDIDEMFQDIADELLNKYVLTVNYKFKYRITELEFYFHDNRMHPDTFTHNNYFLRDTCQWYFLRSGQSYKAGTYKGINVAFGKGEQAYGGILIRSIQRVDQECMDKAFTIEGPCNCVNQIFLHNNTREQVFKEVKEFVQLEDFSLDLFNKNSRIYLTHLNDKENQGVNFEKRTTYRCPRVGLTLNRMDEYKTKYWLKDYRFLLYPERHKKMSSFILLSMIKTGTTFQKIKDITKAKQDTLDDLKIWYDKGLKEQKKTIKDFSRKDMKNSDWAFAYGLHQNQKY